MASTLDLLRIFQVAILILGIIVVYYSQKGYRKTKSRSLLFLALGFMFVTIGAALAGLSAEIDSSDQSTAPRNHEIGREKPVSEL